MLLSSNMSNNTCKVSYKPPRWGGLGGSQTHRKYTSMGNIPVKCPMCKNACFYGFTTQVHSMRDPGNTGKRQATSKLLAKKIFGGLLKPGRLVKNLSCSHCSYILSYRNFDQIVEKRGNKNTK